jgi:hypothetical protein
MGRPMLDVGIALQHVLLELRHFGVGLVDRDVLRQVPVNDELGPVGVGEELLLDEFHTVNRGGEGD